MTTMNTAVNATRKNVTPRMVEEMFRLRNEEGLTNVEIAKTMGLSYNTVYRHVDRQPEEMTAMYRDLTWKHLGERRAVRSAVVAKLRDRVKEAEAERLAIQLKIKEASEIIAKRSALLAQREEAEAALKALNSVLEDIEESANESEEYLSKMADGDKK